MPIRGMMYAAKLYNKHIEKHDLNIYGEKLMRLPAPQYVVFYNGDAEHEDEEILRLSDAFDNAERIEGYEWTARMLNINYGRNRELLARCKPLRDYTIFVDKVKTYVKQEQSLQEAVNQAVDECIKENIMADFLIAHRAEVVDVCITEYNEEKVMDAIRKEYWLQGHEEGWLQGHEEGRLQEHINGIRNTIQTALDFGADIQVAVSKAAERYGEDEERIWDIWKKTDN